MGELAGAAHFWAMRSCEYAKVPKAEQRQTKQLCLWNIAFIRDGKTLDHSSASLHLADCILITFEQQKNDRKEMGDLFIYLALAKPALPGQFVLFVSSQSKEKS